MTKRILAIEDDPDLSFLYRTFLESEGHEVTIARDAESALRMLRDPPDLVVLDLMLPDADGYTLLRHMRADPRLRDIPVVVVSAALPPGRHRVPGADAVIHKPFEFDGLLRVINGIEHHQRHLSS